MQSLNDGSNMTDLLSRKERREQRRRALGVDCVDCLTWKDWVPGKEYTRKILVKNIDRDSRTVQLSLPANRKVFMTPFPEPIALSSGVSHEIVIIFRPKELVELHDAVTITVEGRGSFQVRLDCLTPYAKLQLPSNHDFGYCPVGTTAHAQVQLRNSGTAPVEFSWEVSAPFCILPSHAVLDEGDVMQIALLFTPTEACTMVAKAVCRLTGTDKVIATLKVSGIGKHPYICFQDPSAEEGTLAVQMEAQHSSCSKLIHLRNPSPVPVSVRIRRVDQNLVCAFRLSIEGKVEVKQNDPNDDDAIIIPRGGVQLVRIHYTPSSPGAINFNTFQFNCAHGNSLQLELSGMTLGPRVTASSSTFDYGAVDLEHLPTVKQRTHHLILRNTSTTDANFVWMNTSPGAAFLVEPHRGVVAAQSSLQVAITFQPTHPILYYRRLHLLIEGAKDAVVVDVLGGAYTSALRPPMLTLKDVEAARLRMERGLGLLTPEELASVAAAAAAGVEPRGSEKESGQQKGLKSAATASVLRTWRRIEEEVRSPSVGMRETKRKLRVPLCNLETPNGSVSIDTHFGIDAKALYTFGGAGSTANDSRGQLVTIMNTSEAAAVATWSLPAAHLCPYVLVPAQQFVPPNGSAVFQLQCNSAVNDELPAACTLECYVNYDSMSAFYLAPDACVLPPQCFTVTCTNSVIGTSASAKQGSKQQHRGASSQISCPREVRLPACCHGSSSYQVIALQNKASTPVRYEVTGITLNQVSAVVAPPNTTPVAQGLEGSQAVAQQGAVDMGEAIFSMFPTEGVVPARGRHLLVVKFNPRDTAQYAATAAFLFNANRPNSTTTSPADTMRLSLFGEVCLPQLQWHKAGASLTAPLDMLALPLTCISGEAPQSVWLRNPTVLSVQFSLVPSAELLGVVRMEPERGTVPGGMRLPVKIFFSPQQPRVYDGFLWLYVQNSPEGIAATKATQQQYCQRLRVRGEGVRADVEMEPRIIDAGEATDTREQQVALTLYNSGYCDVQYDVRTVMVHTGQSGTAAAVVPRLHNSRGVLPARTHTTVLVAAQPAPGLTEFIVYAIVSGLSTVLADVPNASTVEEAELHPHCRWRLRAAHPAVQVVDVDFPGVARPLAWQQLSLNAINAQLATDALEPADSSSGSNASFQHYVNGLEPISMDLGVAHVDDSAVRLTVSLRNTGDCPAPFDVMLPTQHEANREHWCLENTELEDLYYIIHRGLLTVTPQQGSIEVGQTVKLEVCYVHEEVGVHRLPMVLRVGRGGRRVAVVLEGRTLPPEVRALDFHHENVYELMPVALGDMEPPLQFITATNPFDEPVEYSVDLATLEEHTREHYGFPVFQCVDPQGTVSPRGTVHIGFYFRPLEVKEYRVSVLVQVAEGEGYYVDLIGRGYHPRKAPATSVMQWIDKALMQIPTAPPALGARAPAALLSNDVCTLGAVPYFALCRRTCTLHLAADCLTAMRYTWHAFHPQRGDAQIVLHPSEGVVQPGKEQMFRILFYAGSTSQVLERLMTCTVIPCAASRDGKEKRRDATGGHLARHAAATSRPSSNSSRHGGSGAVTLNLLFQARVMPRDDYEALYGSDKLNVAYTPALYHSHLDPMLSSAPSTAASQTTASPASSTEVRFVKTIMDELIRNVVTAPAVQNSFTALLAPRHVTYAKMKVLHAAKKASTQVLSATPPQAAAAAAEPGKQHASSAVATEEVLEELLRNALAEAVASV
ncbi:hypothetical protein JKF63_00289 [Porcisia hertigi]|uniref:Abnormal spindle-like microcephaly-associated protein ASH domain-containing protein n=1 Tax=Porcisia hertigi TaxID=2761500 RepID=A0A836HTC5_9TRYP|nr:hypothetical protein JKF63_00289 [Porcisia hertigi]